MIEIKHLTKTYTNKNNTVRILYDLSFDIQDGDIFGIVGKSGAGKTTLLKLLALQTKPSAGFINFLGYDDVKKTALINQTAFVFQGFSLLYNLSIIDNVALPLLLRGVSKQIRMQKALEVLRFVGLESKAYHYPITLSGGEAQRIAIARSLVTDPKIIYFDEPTSSLDEETTLSILDIIRRIHDTYHTTIIMVSHQLAAIKYICNRVLLLEEGKIKRVDTIQNDIKLVTSYEESLWGQTK